ncbi:hypothetical protein P43SY_007812 [Pythium insidiosum]|uniref:BD-FAE-like domain-containing protein n=1 Tax=Pythium insidiosum TaxID=114742 RepID=A0AAD5LUV2_PYTIN|nr:hypothetical protein P43SY_007812 [Pythium insidiosum]
MLLLRRRWLTTAAAPFAWKDVHYTAQRHEKQTLNIAIPSDRFPRGHGLPTCVFVHGGSWQRGDKSGLFNDGIELAFVRSGWVGVSVNYRLSPEVRHPHHTCDLAEAVSWIHRNAETFGGDPNRIILVGHSAGAHLVMQLMADPEFLFRHGVDHSVVSSVVGISGVYNVVRLANAPLYGPLVVNPAFGELAEQWREGSITSSLIRYGSASPLYRTPTLLLTAEEDYHFDEDAEELESWLVEGGNVNVERAVVPQRNHFTIIRDLTHDLHDETMKRIAAFVKSTLAPQQQAPAAA